VWIAHGVRYVLQAVATLKVKWSRAAALLLCAALLALPLGSLALNLPQVDLSNDTGAYDYGSQVFSQVPDGSIIISATDPHTFTLWYFTRVVVNRDKVALIDRDLLGYDWYVAGLGQSYPWLDLSPGPGGGPLSIAGVIQANMQRCAIFLADVDPELMARYPFQQQDLVYRLKAEPPSAL
jgi:hypothetical protein